MTGELLSSSRSRMYAALVGLSMVSLGLYRLPVVYSFASNSYLYVMAQAFLSGHISLPENPSRYFVELVPLHGVFYSVFSLGSVLLFIPVILLGITPQGLTMLLGLGFVLSGWSLGAVFSERLRERTIAAVLLAFGSWLWCNTLMGGSWQHALAFAVIGTTGALGAVLGRHKRPWLAGLLFAVGFAGRTELVLAAPFFLYALARGKWVRSDSVLKSLSTYLRKHWVDVCGFLLIPLMLGLATMLYNYVRFDSVANFGHALIPGVLDEPLYSGKLFSISSIAHNARHMLITPSWGLPEGFPPAAVQLFGGSILTAAPWIILIFRDKARDIVLNRFSWATIAALTLVLWLHGDTGGVQFSYRYASILLPWFLVIYFDRRSGKIDRLDWFFIGASIILNILSVLLWHRLGWVM